MAQRTVDVTLISAEGLRKVTLLSRMKVYAVASLSGDPFSRQRTHADRHGGCSPSWNTTLRFAVPASASRLSLHILLRAKRALGDRDVGEVHVPLDDLLVAGAAGDVDPPTQFASYQILKVASAKPCGVLKLSYKLGETLAADPAPYPPPVPKSDLPVAAYPPMNPKVNEPVTAYPVGSSSAAAYPPPPYGYAPGYGYGNQPPPPYGYAPGYGYPPPPPQQVVQPQKRNNMGLGLGAGLLGGVLGGLLIGDLIDDGFDGGFGL